MSWWFVYWITRLDAIYGLFFSIGVVSVVMLVLAIGLYPIIDDAWISEGSVGDEVDNRDNRYKKYTRMIKGLALAAIISAVLTCFVPTTKEAAAIYVLPKVVNNEQVQDMPDKMLQLFSEKLDEWAGDIEKKGD